MGLRTRNRHCHVHIKFDWYCICPFASLPVLLLVCPTNPSFGLEDEIPGRYQVSFWFLEWRLLMPYFRLALILCIEYTWNVFPSTTLSSGLLLAANTSLLVGVWFGFAEGKATV